MIRIGLLGASRIARDAVIRPAADIEGIEVVSIAARSSQRAREYADFHSIAAVEPDYAALVASAKVDLVYNGLPPSEHMSWTIAALQAGKHVLCEKPFAMNADEAKAMVGAAVESGRVLIEAFHYRFHPLFGRVLQIIESNAIGPVQRVDCDFNVPIPYRPGELRYEKKLGGGAMMDLGCYPVHWARSVIGGEPKVVAAATEQHESGVDVCTEAELEFPGGVSATVNCSMSESLPQKLDAELRVTGENGRLKVMNPLAPHIGHELILQTGSEHKLETVGGDTTYHHQLRHVIDVIGGSAVQLTGGTDAIANMRVLDEVYRLSC